MVCFYDYILDENTLTADCKAELADTVVVGPPAPPETAAVGLSFA